MCRLLVQAQQRGNRGEVSREIDVVSTWHVRPAPPRSAGTFATRSGSGPGPGRDGVAGVHEIAPVCQVDDAVGVGCRLPDDVQVVEVAVADLGAGGLQLLRRRVGTGQSDRLVPGGLRSGMRAEPMWPDPPVMDTRILGTSRLGS